MLYVVFCWYYGSGNGNFFSISRKTYTNILNRIYNNGNWKICISCNFCQFHFCRAYDCYNFLLTGDSTYKDKSFYYCATTDISSCSIGMGVSLHRLKCSVVDISGYRDYCKYNRDIDNIDFEQAK